MKVKQRNNRIEITSLAGIIKIYESIRIKGLTIDICPSNITNLTICTHNKIIKTVNDRVSLFKRL